MEIRLARPRGFCAGVDRAVDVVEMALEVFGAPVYVRHEIVHNSFVVDGLRAKGAVFVDDLAGVPEGAPLVFSAHGVSPAVRAEAAARKLRVVDATCPLVTKVHLEALRYARLGYSILLIGHLGHIEVEGTLGEAPEVTRLVDSVAAARAVEVPDPDRVAYLTQTTLSVDEAEEIVAALRERFPALAAPPRGDICYATTNRQRAVKGLAAECEVVLVIGSPTSSNSNRLVEVATQAGARAYLVDGAADLRREWLAGARTVGVTAGASAPEVLVEEVVARLREWGGSEPRESEAPREDLTFTLPRELAEQARARGVSPEQLEKHRRARGSASRAV
ncbi:MAG TPA: 4-hydroxy-3-methylbut-2-enyl diphosphate reductase [Candidatus Saccharimonadales bacterium]|nr:4-hydroxy-3-methylbut-2-enyl diphosphate reductase [Candidatus Saccharimonadales bacterium]